VLVAAFATLDAAQSAADRLGGDAGEHEIVGTALRPAPAVDQLTGRRLGGGLARGVLLGVAVGALLAVLDSAHSRFAPLVAGCVLVGMLVGLFGVLRPGRRPEGAVLATRYELRAPDAVADALRDRVRASKPAGLVELGTAAPRSALRPAPLGALDSQVRTADEALGLSPR
jgi:hypothetical protein